MMQEVIENIWSDSERQAWRPPDLMTVSEWAGTHRILDAKNCAEPGPWKNERTPYMVEVMDAFVDSGIEEITFKKSTQVGGSEAIFNQMGYVVDQDPGPGLYVKAREDDVYSDAHNRLRPMFSESLKLSSHIPSKRAADLMQKEFRLIEMTLFFAGSNSPAALASKPVRYLWLDETDKYPRFSGREASPIKLARERTRTFWNRKIVKVSSPTTKHGYIHKEYLKSDQRKYYVPCPHCDHYQILVFQNVTIPEDERDPGRIRELKIAWYECEVCKEKIFDQHKPKMLSRGVWLSKGQEITKDGEVIGERPHGNHAGFWINCLYSPWLTFSEIMAEFLESKDEDQELMNFINSWLAELWEEKAEYKGSDEILKSRSEYPARVVPAGAVLLTAGVDVQKHFLYYVIRAWGAKMRSWLVDEGQLEGDDLSIIDNEIIDINFPIFNSENERSSGIFLCCVDSGYRTDEVYEFCHHHDKARAIKGASQRNPARPFWATVADVHPVTGERLKFGYRFWMLDTEFFKNFIYRRVQFLQDHEMGWHYHQDISLDYAEQITSEKRITIRRGRQEWEEWQKKAEGRANHLWDAEVYSAAAAHMVRNVIEVEVRKREQGSSSKKKRGRKSKKSFIPKTKGWLNR
jgi:phage terminase large subunit GpA-like protein